MSNAEDMHIVQLIEAYRATAGRVVAWYDIVVALVAGGTALLTAMNTPKLFNSVAGLASAVAGISGSLLGLAIAAMAIAAGLFVGEWGEKVRKLGYYPALLLPYWLTGCAWAASLGISLVLLLLAGVPNFPQWIGVALLSTLGTVVGLALTWSLGLFGSILRALDVKLATPVSGSSHQRRH